MFRKTVGPLLLWLAAAGLARGEGVVGKLDLQERLKDEPIAGDWIYDDLAGGFAEARKTGKPLLAYLRCVP
ncbi:MAG: hypothetical protein ACYS47_00950 [Planctomycetota bacterium]|jgi:hypothetical protein